MRVGRLGIVTLALLALVVCLAWRPVLLAIGDYLVVQDELVPADVIDVLSGPDYRVDYAIRLYQQGYGGLLFCTGQGVQAEQTR